VVSDEIGNYDGSTARYALLTMDQHVLSAPQSLVDIFASSLEMAFQICTRHVENIDSIALESVFLRQREPRHVKDLYEMGYILLVKDGFFHRCG